MPQAPNLILEQRLPPSGRQQVILAGDREVRVVVQRGRQTLNYAFDVLALEPRGRARLYIPWRWLALAATALLLMAVNQLWLFALLGSVAGWTIHALAGLTALLSLYLTMQCLVGQKVFVTRVARVPVLRLAVNRPSRKDYRRFLAALRERIDALGETVKLPVEQRMAGELKMLRRLSRQGVISTETYEKAKKRLLGV